VSAEDLYKLADEAAKRLAAKAAVFIQWDNGITIQSGLALYSLQTRHMFTLLAASGQQLLRLTAVGELYALDSRWPAASGDPKRCSLDAGAPRTITLYPIPVSGAALGQILQEYPPEVTEDAASLPLPSILRDYLTYAMLAGARGKESEAAMPEMAEHFGERVKLYERVIEHLWGAGQ